MQKVDVLEPLDDRVEVDDHSGVARDHFHVRAAEDEARLHGRIGAELGDAGQCCHGQVGVEGPGLVDLVLEDRAGDPGRELIPGLTGVPCGHDLLGGLVGHI